MDKLRIRCAIVDDDLDSVESLSNYLRLYANENDIDISISSFNDSAGFIFEYQAIYDVIFLDVQMPKYNGMQVAEEIRKKDDKVFIIFQTRFWQFALQGYQYNALDYFVKPVSYQSLKMRMTMIKKKMSQRENMISFTTEDNILKIMSINEIVYIEEVGRKQVFHTIDGKEYTNIKREGLSKLEEKLKDKGFARCNSGFLLNLKKCTGIKKGVVYIGNMPFEISRTLRKSFLEQLSNITKG